MFYPIWCTMNIIYVFIHMICYTHQVFSLIHTFPEFWLLARTDSTLFWRLLSFVLGCLHHHMCLLYHQRKLKVPSGQRPLGVWARPWSKWRQLSTKFDNKTQDKKDRDLPCRLFIGNGVSISRQEECSGRQEKTLTWAVCNKGLRDALLRGPKTLYCATESHRTVSSGRFLGSPEARLEWSMRGWLRR